MLITMLTEEFTAHFLFCKNVLTTFFSHKRLDITGSSRENRPNFDSRKTNHQVHSLVEHTINSDSLDQPNMLSMKTLFSGFLTSLVLFFSTSSFSQCTAVSINGYQVNMRVTPVNLIINNNGGGCNYVTVLQYSVTFSGINIPASMFTLQGTVRCGNSDSFFDLPNNGGQGTTNAANASYGPNCSGLTVNNFCSTVKIQIQGPGLPSQTITCAYSPLPIELMSFDAYLDERQVQINWSTGSEKDNDFFTVEKSRDGENYEVVQVVNGGGSTSQQQNYAVVDHTPYAGVSYYRLRQTDYNGISATFDPVSVNLHSERELVSNIYPNPSNSSTVNLAIAAVKDAPIELYVLDLMGKVVQTQIIHPNPSGSTVAQVELPETGNSFFLELIQENVVIDRHKVIVNR
jgi:hypothetical protein